MDLYRFFHPHHNPRLNNVPIRYAELSELLQATIELRKALERAQHRTSKAPCDPILPKHFVDAIKASKFVEEALGIQMRRFGKWYESGQIPLAGTRGLAASRKSSQRDKLRVLLMRVLNRG